MQKSTENQPERLIFGTWRGRRDLNPRAGFIQPTPLAGEPLRPLGYFRRSMVFYEIGGESGIRTHGDLRLAGFQDRFLKPLGHLSIGVEVPRLSNARLVYHRYERFVN